MFYTSLLAHCCEIELNLHFGFQKKLPKGVKPSLGQYTMSFGLDNCANVRWRISWRNKHSNEIDESMHQNGTKFQHVTCV